MQSCYAYTTVNALSMLPFAQGFHPVSLSKSFTVEVVSEKLLYLDGYEVFR